MFVLIMFHLSWLISKVLEYVSWFSFHENPLPQKFKKFQFFFEKLFSNYAVFNVNICCVNIAYSSLVRNII